MGLWVGNYDSTKNKFLKTKKSTSKLVCTPCTATFFIYWHFIFLFQLTVLTKSKQYILWSEAYYLLTWSLLHPTLCFDSIIFHFEYIFHTLKQERHNMALCYTNIFFYEMRKQKVRFRVVWIYNFIFFIIH